MTTTDTPDKPEIDHCGWVDCPDEPGDAGVTDEHRLFGTAVWLELLAKRFADEWPETAQQALANAAELKRIVNARLVEPSALSAVGRYAELVERLRQLRVVLKSGEYDGADLMRAWCAMIDAADAITRLEADNAAKDARVGVLQGQLQFLCDKASAIMAMLETHGGIIVPHLLDSDENAGQFLRDAVEDARAAIQSKDERDGHW